MGKARRKYTGEKIKARKAKQEKRQQHIQAIYDGDIAEKLPEPLLPNVFKEEVDVPSSILNSIEQLSARMRGIPSSICQVSKSECQ